MSVPYYPQNIITPNLGLALNGMDEVLAEDMILIDNAFGSGSAVRVNGAVVSNPNFNGTTPAAPVGDTNVTFQTDINGNTSAFVPSSVAPILPVTKAAIASNWLNSYNAATGLFTATQPAASDLSNGTTGTGAVVLASAISGFGTGSVTSVSSGNVDSIATVSVATATTTPAISFALSTQTANTVWAGPTTGSAAAPTFRALVAADIPAITVPWSSLGNALANLTLANAGFTTTFNQTSAVAWLWKNTTVATVSTTNASPLLELAANYWATGAVSAPDTWTMQSSVAAGLNGVSTLAFSHAGSTATPFVFVPNLQIVGAGLLVSRTWVGNTSSTTTVAISATNIGISQSGCAITWVGDAGISRLGAASLAIGNGTAGNTTGNLSYNRVNLAGADYAGQATITAASTTQAVTFAANYTGTGQPVIVLTPTSDPLALGVPVGYWVTYSGGAGAWTGFVVNIQTALAGNVTFNYIVIGKA
jgi:hypothetical protein